MAVGDFSDNQRAAIREETRSVLASEGHKALLREVFFACWREVKAEVKTDRSMALAEHAANCPTATEIRRVRLLAKGALLAWSISLAAAGVLLLGLRIANAINSK
ncbi:hypothetical protein D4Q85_00235 [bacterium]|nr:MAG: hypothetical protein D4Q85_00235 [bacterium]